MSRRKVYSGVCEWDGCNAPCRARWCAEHRPDAYRRMRAEGHQRRKADPQWAAKARAASRDYMAAKRSNWTDDERKQQHQIRRLSKYGLTPAQYAELLKRHCHRCAICERTDSGNERDWHVDHDHETGEVRGILCHFCNTGLGQFKDSEHLLLAAAHYLRASRLAKAA